MIRNLLISSPNSYFLLQCQQSPVARMFFLSEVFPTLNCPLTAVISPFTWLPPLFPPVSLVLLCTCVSVRLLIWGAELSRPLQRRRYEFLVHGVSSLHLETPSWGHPGVAFVSLTSVLHRHLPLAAVMGGILESPAPLWAGGQGLCVNGGDVNTSLINQHLTLHFETVSVSSNW